MRRTTELARLRWRLAGIDSGAGLVDFVGHQEVHVIRVPSAMGLLPPREVEVTSEAPPPPEERGMSSWRDRGEGDDGLV